MTMPAADENCRICKSARWVCERHSDRPWGVPGGCDCGAPGMPCALCNPSGGEDDPPDLPPGFVPTVTLCR
jgi:hypothetical protein